MKIVSLINADSWERIMTEEQETRLNGLGEYYGPCLEGDDLKQAALERINSAGGADILLGCWGTPELDSDIVSACGNLKLFAYGAGSVKKMISKETIASGVQTTTAAPAISLGVAEFALTQMYSFAKKIHYLRVRSKDSWGPLRAGSHGQNVFEIYKRNIGLVGAGFIGRRMIELLREYDVNVMVYDPFLTAETAAEMNITKIDDLVELAAQCSVLSLHAPSIPSTRHMINKDILAALPDGALLINTARGSLIDENALIAELEQQRIYACLDVTDPEPPEEDSPLYNFENCFLTPHVAGCLADNHKRLSALMTDEVEAFVNGQPLHYEVPVDKYDIMA